MKKIIDLKQVASEDPRCEQFEAALETRSTDAVGQATSVWKPAFPASGNKTKSHWRRPFQASGVKV